MRLTSETIGSARVLNRRRLRAEFFIEWTIGLMHVVEFYLKPKCLANIESAADDSDYDFKYRW